MSTANFDVHGSSSSKRSRPENDHETDYPISIDDNDQLNQPQITSDGPFRSKKLRSFTSNNGKIECVVVADVGGNSRRHLCSSPPYATAAGELPCLAHFWYEMCVLSRVFFLFCYADVLIFQTSLGSHSDVLINLAIPIVCAHNSTSHTHTQYDPLDPLLLHANCMALARLSRSYMSLWQTYTVTRDRLL